jgi:hypothetical protein
MPLDFDAVVRESAKSRPPAFVGNPVHRVG